VCYHGNSQWSHSRQSASILAQGGVGCVFDRCGDGQLRILTTQCNQSAAHATTGSMNGDFD
jgi:hypothetical protein